MTPDALVASLADHRSGLPHRDRLLLVIEAATGLPIDDLRSLTLKAARLALQTATGFPARLARHFLRAYAEAKNLLPSDILFPSRKRDPACGLRTLRPIGRIQAWRIAHDAVRRLLHGGNAATRGAFRTLRRCLSASVGAAVDPTPTPVAPASHERPKIDPDAIDDLLDGIEPPTPRIARTKPTAAPTPEPDEPPTPILELSLAPNGGSALGPRPPSTPSGWAHAAATALKGEDGPRLLLDRLGLAFHKLTRSAFHNLPSNLLRRVAHAGLDVSRPPYGAFPDELADPFSPDNVARDFLREFYQSSDS